MLAHRLLTLSDGIFKANDLVLLFLLIVLLFFLVSLLPDGVLVAQSLPVLFFLAENFSFLTLDVVHDDKEVFLCLVRLDQCRLEAGEARRFLHEVLFSVQVCLVDLNDH